MGICSNCFREYEGAGCPYCGYAEGSDAEKFPLALPHGTILGGRYITGRVLGQGGFGITYVAQDYTDKKLVAVKEFFPEQLALRSGSSVSTITGEREDAFRYGKECFLSEAKTLAEFIGNPNIVRVYSYFEENNTAYFAMEYIAGISLKEYLNTPAGRIPYEEAKNLLLPVMDALTAVQAKGIIHRDISPDNIFITRDGTVKLIDFGAARYSMGDRSRSLDVVLKHGYAPKEQYTRRGRQGPYTDIYALAATFYRAITGRIPPDSIDRLEEDDLIAPSVLGCSIPPSAEDALLKALSLSPTDRFQTMARFKAALNEDEASVPSPLDAAVSEASFIPPETVHDEPVAASVAAVPLITEPSVGSAPPEIEIVHQDSGKKKRLVSFIAAATLVVAAVVLLIILLPKGGEDPSSTVTATTKEGGQPQSDNAGSDASAGTGDVPDIPYSDTPSASVPETQKPTSPTAPAEKPTSSPTVKPTSAPTTAPTSPPTVKPTSPPPTSPPVYYVNVTADGVTYSIKSGDYFTYTYYLCIDGAVNALEATTTYDSSGLQLLPDSLYYPIIGDSMVSNATNAGIIRYNYTKLNGENFSSWNSVLMTATFRVTAKSGAYDIDTYLYSLAGDPDFTTYIKNGVMQAPLTRCEGVISY